MIRTSMGIQVLKDDLIALFHQPLDLGPQALDLGPQVDNCVRRFVGMANQRFVFATKLSSARMPRHAATSRRLRLSRPITDGLGLSTYKSQHHPAVAQAHQAWLETPDQNHQPPHGKPGRLPMKIYKEVLLTDHTPFRVVEVKVSGNEFKFGLDLDGNLSVWFMAWDSVPVKPRKFVLVWTGQEFVPSPSAEWAATLIFKRLVYHVFVE